MRTAFRFWMAAATLCASVTMAAGQQKEAEPASRVHLELTAEVAATTDEGYPSVVRITLKNTGNVATDLPMPGVGCGSNDGTVQVQLGWSSADGLTGRGWGCESGIAHKGALLDRARNEWIRLQPGEFIVFSENIRARLGKLDAGKVTYRAEYFPPPLTPTDLGKLTEAGYNVPTRNVEAEQESFEVY